MKKSKRRWGGRRSYWRRCLKKKSTNVMTWLSPTEIGLESLLIRLRMSQYVLVRIIHSFKTAAVTSKTYFTNGLTASMIALIFLARRWRIKVINNISRKCKWSIVSLTPTKVPTKITGALMWLWELVRALGLHHRQSREFKTLQAKTAS